MTFPPNNETLRLFSQKKLITQETKSAPSAIPWILMQCLTDLRAVDL